MARQSAIKDHVEYVRAIGMISIENANLDLALGNLLARVIFVPKDVGVTIYTTPKSSMARLEILGNAAVTALKPIKSEVADARRSAALKKILSIVKRAKTVATKRHEAIHHAWELSPDSSEVVRRALPVKVGDAPQPVPLAKLIDLVRDTQQLIQEAVDLSKAFKREPPRLIPMRIA